jgi:DNA-binding transcriptional ArsR family regulator
MGYGLSMRATTNVLFSALADPTRRAIFERLARDGEQTVRALTSQSGVSQPAVSKHLAILKLAGLVRDRHEGRQTHYSRAAGPSASDRLDGSLRRLLA